MPLTALVMAGGRYPPRDAAAAGTQIKALALVNGVPLLARVLAALGGVAAVERVVVVGPEAVRAVALAGGAAWAAETGRLLGNVQAGVAAAGLTPDGRVLLAGSDLAAPRAESLADFARRAPGDVWTVAVPLVARAAFDAAFPGCPGAYVPLREGEFTIGSQFLAPAGLLMRPPPAVAAMLGRRKSQLRMAATLGPSIAWGLLRRTLTVDALERRAGALLGVPTHAVRGCAADLAFDIDDRADLEYARSQIPAA